MADREVRRIGNTPDTATQRLGSFDGYFCGDERYSKKPYGETRPDPRFIEHDGKRYRLISSRFGHFYVEVED